jgi:hypothetical protein
LNANNISEQDLLQIKRLLAKFFMQKAISEADKVWDEKGCTNETMNNCLKAS